MRRRPPFDFAVPTVVLALAALAALGDSAARADGVPPPAAAVATPTSAPSSRAVYGTWTTPRSGGYGTWTTPQPARYGTWTTPATGGYGRWETSRGSPRAGGAPSVSVPASAAVAAPAYTPSPRAVAACAPPPCDDEDWSFDAWGRYGRPSIAGEVLITRGGVPGSGTEVDVEDQMDLETGDGFEAGFAASFRRHRVTLGFEFDSFSGDSTLDRTIVYRGATYLAGVELESDLELTFWKLGYDYEFIDDDASRWPGFSLRAGVSAWLWKYDGRLRSGPSDIDQSREFSHGMPMATVEAEWESGAFHVGVRAAGGLLAEDRYIVDLELSLGVELLDRLSLDVGYRLMNLSFHETTNEGDLTLYGPFASVGLEF